MKTCTYERVLTNEASVGLGEICARLCEMVGFAAQAVQAFIRVRRYGDGA